MKQTKALQDKNSLVAQISKFFDKEKVEQLAHETKFVQRESNMKGLDFFFLCLFAHQQNYEISLDGLSNELMKDGVCMSKQSIHDRFNPYAVEFMEQLLSEAISQKLSIGTLPKHPLFHRIVVEDSTSFQVPEMFAYKYKGSGGGASDAAIKIQYAYDLISEKIISMVAQSGVNPDSKQELGEVKKTTYE
jgi:hypothetical protein